MASYTVKNLITPPPKEEVNWNLNTSANINLSPHPNG